MSPPPLPPFCQKSFFFFSFWLVRRIAHLRVAFRLSFKKRPSAKPFIWKSVLLKISFIHKQSLVYLHVKVSLLISIWIFFALGLALKQTEAKGNSEIAYYSNLELWLAVISFTASFSCLWNWMWKSLRFKSGSLGWPLHGKSFPACSKTILLTRTTCWRHVLFSAVFSVQIEQKNAR